jgi:predicted PurR-regulated permease PerM
MEAGASTVANSIDTPTFEPLLEGKAREAEVRASADPRTIALTLISVLLALFAVRIAAAFLIPLLLSLFLNYALSPVVTKLARGGLARPIGAAVVIVLVIATLTGAAYRVGNDAADVLQQMPEAVQRLRLLVARASQDHTGALEHVKRAATELEALANAAATTGTSPRATAAQHGSAIDIPASQFQ